MKRLIFALLTFCSFLSTQAEKKKVLIIGDSISIAYTPHVINELKDIADVKRHKGNAGPSLHGLDNIDQWLGDTKWDIIHFNWGLWDMYRWRYEKFDQSPEAYAKNLDKLVSRLKKTGAKLIWATTTPACPKGEKKIKIKIDKATEAKYLSAAAKVMKKHGVTVNDLNAFMAPQWEKYKIADNDVHYNKEGSKALGKKVAEAIRKELSN